MNHIPAESDPNWSLNSTLSPTSLPTAGKLYFPTHLRAVPACPVTADFHSSTCSSWVSWCSTVPLAGPAGDTAHRCVGVLCLPPVDMARQTKHTHKYKHMLIWDCALSNISAWQKGKSLREAPSPEEGTWLKNHKPGKKNRFSPSHLIIGSKIQNFREGRQVSKIRGL